MARQPDTRQLAVLYQILLVVIVGIAGWYLITTAMDNLLARRIASGFGFLRREAGFEIGETTLIAYSAADSYLRALAVGLLNTFRVALLAVLFSTVIGVAIGLARLSPNWLLAKLAAGYVELLRNIPLVVQLFFGTP
jgi:general L-amino acid transport system permease protein